MKKLALMMMVTLFALNTAYAKSERKGKGKGFGKIFKELGLSDEQKEKIKSFRLEGKKSKANHKESKEKIKALREKMKASFASSASESELKALHTELTGLRSQQNNERFEKMLKIRSVLTPEQRVKFQELKGNKREGKKSRVK